MRDVSVDERIIFKWGLKNSGGRFGLDLPGSDTEKGQAVVSTVVNLHEFNESLRIY